MVIKDTPGKKSNKNQTDFETKDFICLEPHEVRPFQLNTPEGPEPTQKEELSDNNPTFVEDETKVPSMEKKEAFEKNTIKSKPISAPEVPISLDHYNVRPFKLNTPLGSESTQDEDYDENYPTLWEDEMVEEESEENNYWDDLFGHHPVMVKEVLDNLKIIPHGFYIDATLGGGGHSRRILKELGPKGRLLTLDLDPEAIQFAESWGAFDSRVIVRQGNFRDLGRILREEGLGKADGILADLGVSSRQLLDLNRGFSFSGEGPLDMRFDTNQKTRAWDILHDLPEEKLANIIYNFGEERRSRRLAKEIVAARKRNSLQNTSDLAYLAVRVLSRPGTWQRLHPATRLFMALRIAVNDELNSLKIFLDEAYKNLKRQGRLVIISFHSLEDRLIKEAFRARNENETTRFRSLTKRILQPEEEEISDNPRARSARLRVAEKILVRKDKRLGS
ncbi:MAG: 16S rRNA (cytosine(1402)-N(4))-methyltransferase RsmH [Deltaproteobacteria bacterium]|jgi:16S rRNA (cytosine1402-N4)-methyltransferase|nr:16S rRNA (cytosine(1402)-N(4))-methyltransferase RsmH [Deltaproteobacteria bacterium]